MMFGIEHSYDQEIQVCSDKVLRVTYGWWHCFNIDW